MPPSTLSAEILMNGTLSRKAVAACAVAGVIIFRRLWMTWRFRPRNVPIPGKHWLLGDSITFFRMMHAALSKKHLELACEVHAEFGKTVALQPPFQPWWVVTACPKNVEHILSKNFENYPKGDFQLPRLMDLLGNGIFNADGKSWLHQRKTASQMFTAKLFKEHIWIVVHRNARKLRDILTSVSDDKPVDIFNLMNRFTLDTIGEIGFAKNIGSLDDPSSPFLRSFDQAQQIAFKRFFLPPWRFLKFFGMGPEKETIEHFSRLDEYSRQVVRDLQSNIAAKGEHDAQKQKDEAQKSFVGLFLADAMRRGENLSEEYLRDLVLNFLIAGRDTTAQALSWTIFCLCTHPEVMAKTRQEVDEVCGVRGPMYDEMKRLPYLQAVLNEALRLYPSVPLDVKTAADDDTLPDGAFVPRGTNIVYNIWAMGRDTSVWGEDATTFRPERWLEMDTVPSNYTYPVFNAGPRECLGRRLAQVEMKTCLAMLLPHLSIQLAVPADEITYDGQLTLGMGSGLPCIVKNLDHTKTSGAMLSTTANSDTESRASILEVFAEATEKAVDA